MVTEASKYADKGKWAEGKVQDWLKVQSDASARFFYHRMPDTRAARNALPPQPADWIVSKHFGTFGFSVWLEAKETKEAHRLPKNKVGQFGKLYAFHLAGMQARVLVYRSLYNDWVFFDNVDLFTDPNLTSFPFAGKQSFPSAADALMEIFK